MNTREKILSKVGLPLGVAAAIPTSVLSGLSAIQGGSGNLADINSLSSALDLIKDASWLDLTYGGVSLLATQLLLSYMNGKYLLDSSKTVIDLIRNDFNFIKSIITCSEYEGEKPTLSENGLFAWCFLTSLIFAELGGETLGFLGKAGFAAGFTLNLFVFFATRFAGARRLLQLKSDQSNRAGELSPEERNRLMELVESIPGITLAILSILPVLLNFIPVSAQGLQSIFHSKLGFHDNYQDVLSFIVGSFITLPTVFFYFITIKDIGNQLIKTVSNGFDSIKKCQFGDLLGLITMTGVAFAASYFTSVGFKLVGSSNINNGYLSYLPEAIAETLSIGLFVSIILMFWSHLQHMVNDRHEQKSKTLLTENSLFSRPNEGTPLIQFTYSQDEEGANINRPGLSPE